MSDSYYQTMPLLIYNLGCEMIYVLSSRLKAQNIGEDKQKRVIIDVANSLFDKKFMSQIQKRQEIARHISVKQLFEKMAHSSIMKLNSSSMSKLFDLILMSVKRQLLRSRYPEEIYIITINHLNSILEMLNSMCDPIITKSTIQIIEDNRSFIEEKYSKMNCWDFNVMRQILLRFFQGKNVKVSIFMQDNSQNSNGVIYLPMREPAPNSIQLPGTVYKYSDNGKAQESNLYLEQSNLYLKPVIHFYIRLSQIDYIVRLN